MVFRLRVEKSVFPTKMSFTIRLIRLYKMYTVERTQQNEKTDLPIIKRSADVRRKRGSVRGIHRDWHLNWQNYWQ